MAAVEWPGYRASGIGIEDNLGHVIQTVIEGASMTSEFEVCYEPLHFLLSVMFANLKHLVPDLEHLWCFLSRIESC